jgi:hypothetical protein
MALFGENYGETVRTVSIGEQERFSYELCGGTHVDETGIIGPFIIVSEASVAAGIRRIEAVTGRGSTPMRRARLGVLDRVAAALGASPEEAAARVEALLDEARLLERQMSQARERVAEASYTNLSPQIVSGVGLSSLPRRSMAGRSLWLPSATTWWHADCMQGSWSNPWPPKSEGVVAESRRWPRLEGRTQAGSHKRCRASLSGSAPTLPERRSVFARTFP